MTPEEQESVNRLRAILPPILDNVWPNLVAAGTAPVCLDLEWNEDTGALETIGIGNEGWVSQFNWAAMAAGDQDRLREGLRREFLRRPVIIQNADGDIRKLRANGFRIFGPSSFFKLEDTMLAHAVLHSEEDHDLGYLNEKLGSLPDYKPLRKIAPREYNAADVVATVIVWRALEKELAADILAEHTYRSQRLPFIWLAIESEEAGVRVNKPAVMPLYEKLNTKREQARKLLVAATGTDLFNINSPDDMKHILYTLEGFPTQREKGTAGYHDFNDKGYCKKCEEDELGGVRNCSGKSTTGKEAIAALRRSVGTEWDEEVAPTLEQARANIDAGGNAALEARYLFMGAQQAVSHYVQPCLVIEGEKITGVRDRIYPELRQHVQASGRQSYVGPALQQFKGDLLNLITPDEGRCWVGHDWKQIEPRILAFEANDAVAIAVHHSGEDFYASGIRELFPEVGGKELEEIRRRFGKAFRLRINYRGKPENAGDIPGTRALGLDVSGLVTASQRYLDAHPALPVYWKELEAEAERTGVVRTWAGTPRRLTSQWPNARKREGSNQPMQGGVADIYSTTALAVKKAAPWARLVFGAHDSMWWQVPVARRLEFLLLYAPIVEREFTINGHVVSFPADYKFKETV
jgi:DNA polymerase I-like protein with 3'-5' exonuclease and polymerase domains